MPYGMPGASRRDAVTNTDIRIARSVRAERSMNTGQPMPVRLILNARRSSAEALPDQPHAPYERVGRHCCRWQRPGRCRGTMCAQKFAGATACRRYRDRESGEITARSSPHLCVELRNLCRDSRAKAFQLRCMSGPDQRSVCGSYNPFDRIGLRGASLSGEMRSFRPHPTQVVAIPGRTRVHALSLR
jgi:hypothetical protein